MAKLSLIFSDKYLKVDFSLELVLVGIKENLMTLVKLYHIREKMIILCNSKMGQSTLK